MIELFRFTDGATTYLYTNHKKNVTFDGGVYKKEIITSGSLTKGDNLSRITLSISISLLNSFAVLMLSSITERAVKVEIFRDGSLYYIGKINKPKFDGTKVVFDTVPTYVNVNNSNALDQLTVKCRYRLYSSRCTISRTSYQKIYPVIGLTSSVLFIPTLEDLESYYTYGIAVLNGEERTILFQDNQTLYLEMKFLSTSGSLYLYPGCNLHSDCQVKFSNGINFGGAKHLPKRNPYNGNGLF